MSDPHGREAWEQRYRERAERPLGPPSAFLLRHLPHLPRGLALDVACGDGRNAAVLVRHGFRVHGIDRSLAALRRARRLAPAAGGVLGLVCADLETFPFPRGRYDLVVNIRYLDRKRLAHLASALRPGGHLLFETFTRGQASLGRPCHPDHLLRPGELGEAFPELVTLDYEEGLFASESGPAYLARLLARRPDAVD